MKTYILDIIPKIQRFSQKLNDITILQNKHWVVLDEESKGKMVFIFREKNNQLLISNNGIIEKGTWDYLGNNSILIDRTSGSYLFKHGFIDDYVLALKVDGVEEYALLVNEEWFEKQLKSLEKVVSFLNEKYLNDKAQIEIPHINKDFNENVSYSDEELIFDIKKRVMDCIEQNFKDLTFLRGIIVTLSLRDNCKLILDKYKRKYNEDLCDEIRLKCPERKSSNYILEPLIKKELTQKIL